MQPKEKGVMAKPTKPMSPVEEAKIAAQEEKRKERKARIARGEDPEDPKSVKGQMNKIVKRAIEETNKEIDSEGNFVGGPTSISVRADTIQGAIDEGRQITNKDLLKDKIEQSLPSQISLKKYEKELERKGLPKDEPGLQDGEDGNIEIGTYDIETLEDLRSTMNPTQKKEFNTRLGEAKDAGQSSFTYNVKLNPAGTMTTEKTSTQKGPMSK